MIHALYSTSMNFMFTENINNIFKKYNIDFVDQHVLISIILNNFNSFYKLSDANKKLTVKDIIIKIFEKYNNEDIHDFIDEQYLSCADQIEKSEKWNRKDELCLYTPEITKNIIMCANELQCFLFNNKGSIVLNENSLNYVPDMLKNGYYGYDENGKFDHSLMMAQLFEKLCFAHIFQDGNKRTALMILLFYEYNYPKMRLYTTDELTTFISNDVHNKKHLTLLPEDKRIELLYQLLV